MTSGADAPADTTMMRIVHQALRRDLRRAQLALASNPLPPRRQQDAIARHVMWMMGFLRAHHRSEDEGLYPLVRARDPDAAMLLDVMHAEHEQVASLMVDVEMAAAAFESQDQIPGRAARRRARRPWRGPVASPPARGGRGHGGGVVGGDRHGVAIA